MAEENAAEPVVQTEEKIDNTNRVPISPYDKMETTFAIIKPDARSKAPEIIMKAQEAGFTVAHSRVLTMTTREAREFYGEHHGKNFFDKLIEFMTR
jgi:hypothetical protein